MNDVMRRRTTCRMYIRLRRSWLLLFVRNSCLCTRKLLAFPFLSPNKKKKLPTTLGKKHIYIFVMRDLITYYPLDLIYFWFIGRFDKEWVRLLGSTARERRRPVGQHPAGAFGQYYIPYPSPSPFTKNFRIPLLFLLLIGTQNIWFWEINRGECAILTNWSVSIASWWNRRRAARQTNLHHSEIYFAGGALLRSKPGWAMM